MNEQFELARRASHEEMNDALGLAGKMRLARRERIGGVAGCAEQPRRKRFSKQSGERDLAQPNATLLKEVAARYVQAMLLEWTDHFDKPIEFCCVVAFFPLTPALSLGEREILGPNTEGPKPC